MKYEFFGTCVTIAVLVCLTAMAITAWTCASQERVKRFDICMFYTGGTCVE